MHGDRPTTDEPVTWFHGLIAERTAEFAPSTKELPFLERQIARFGHPVLDLGCGTGRLLVPLLRAGVDVDGCDVSSDMLRHGREKAAAVGLAPRLYQQPMHSLDLPRTYRTIYSCSSFNLAGSMENGLATLRRCFAQLEEGGALLFDIDAEYTWDEGWEKWTPAKRQALPEPWPEEGRRRKAADGTEYVERQRMVSIDPLEQTMVRQVRIEKWPRESCSVLNSTPSTEPCTCRTRCGSCSRSPAFARSPCAMATRTSRPRPIARCSSSSRASRRGRAVSGRRGLAATQRGGQHELARSS